MDHDDADDGEIGTPPADPQGLHVVSFVRDTVKLRLEETCLINSLVSVLLLYEDVPYSRYCVYSRRDVDADNIRLIRLYPTAVVVKFKESCRLPFCRPLGLANSCLLLL